MWLHVPLLASLCVPASEPSSSACGLPSGPHTELWVTLSGTPTQRPCSWRGWRTRPWIGFLSGTTCRPSTAARGAARWISSLPGSPASRSAPPAGARVPRTNGGSGRTSPGSSKRSARRTRLSRTCPALSVTAWERCFGTLPTSGSMRSGRVSAQPTLAPPTSGNGSGSWPTATSADSRGSGAMYGSGDGYERTTLVDRAVRMWPTPAARGDNRSPEAALAAKARHPGGPGKQVTSLTVLAKMWATPTCRDWKDRACVDANVPTNGLLGRQAVRSGLHPPTTSTPGQASLPTTRVLNPAFTEWLMGWPVGWTDSTRSATESYRSWLRTHSSALWPELCPDPRQGTCDAPN